MEKSEPFIFESNPGQFVKTKVGFGQLFLAIGQFLVIFGEKIEGNGRDEVDRNCVIFGHFWPFAHFLPTFKNKTGHEKTQ